MSPIRFSKLNNRSLAPLAASLLMGAANPIFAQQPAPEIVAVSAQIAGRTPTHIGYVLGENRPGSNVSSWLAYDEINAARFWWPGTVWPASPAAWTGQNTLARFESERAKLRQNPGAGADWKSFGEAVSKNYGGTPKGTLGDAFLVSEIVKMGAAPLVVLSHNRANYPFDHADGTSDWHGRWSFWRGVYLNTFYLARTYGIERFQIFNEPDHKANLDLTQDDYLRRLQLGSDAVQAAISDVNRLDKKSLRAQVSAPVSAGLTVFGPRMGRSDKRDAIRGWGELTVAAQNADFEGKSAANRGLFQAYAFQNYTRTPASITDRLPAMIAGITKANNGAAMPIIVSEMNVSTAGDFSKTDATLDSPNYYAAFAAIAAAYCNAGLSEGYVFRHTQTNNLEGGLIKKNGTHFLDNADPLKNITGSTKGAEAARLWIRGFKGGKTRFAAPVLPAGLHYLAARDETNGAYSLLLSNLGAARQISLDLTAWKLPAGTLATIEEVSETHHGDVKNVSDLPANGQFSLPMSANSVDLLTLRPGLASLPQIFPLQKSSGMWGVASPKNLARNSRYFLALQGAATEPKQRVRVYGGTKPLQRAELLGQITLGTQSATTMVDVTPYASATTGQNLSFQIVPDDARISAPPFSISAVQLRVFGASIPPQPKAK